MKMETKIVSLFTGILFFTACEKVIDIPLEDADRKFVIEGVLRDNPGENYILISKTGSVYESSNFEKISGASVIVTDKNGTQYTFSEVVGAPGRYTHPTFATSTNNSYNLQVISGTETFTSSSESFYKPELDSLSYLEQVGTFGVGTDTTYLVFFNFTDKAGEENHYRLIVYVNGVADGTYYITNDELFDGQTYSQPVFATTIEKGDTVVMELLSMDKSAYTYFFSLSNATAEGPFAPTPANPVSNIEGGAIGYFNAYTSDTMSIIIPQ
jgi:hypothetical protein